jgi:ATP-grasp domain
MEPLKATTRYLVVLESTDCGGLEMGIAITQMGFRPLYLLTPEDYSGDIAMGLPVFEYRVVDTSDPETVVDLLNGLDVTVAGVTSLVDSRIRVAAEVATRLGVPGPDRACIALSDKEQVAEWCAEASPRTEVAAAASEPADAVLERWHDGFGDRPVVVKPRVGCGAVGFRVLEDGKERQEFVQGTPQLDDWLVQEYFPGSLFSLEGWADDAGVHFLGWSSRRKILNTESEFRFEGFDSLPEALTTTAQGAITTLFDRSGYERGWFHIEFLVNEERTDLRMIDANIGRTGGAMLPHAIAGALGLQPTDIYRHAIEAQLWGRPTVDLPKTPHMTTFHKCVCFGSPEAVTLADVRLPGRPIGTGSLRITRILAGGDQVSEMGKDDWSWIGFVAGPEDEVDEYVERVEIHTADAVLKPAY